jgi:carbamoylphosphate synthase large subunit
MSSLTRFADAGHTPRTGRQGRAAPRPSTAITPRGGRATPRVDPESPTHGLSVLMVAFEAGRWGSVRLAKPLREAGFQVTAICPADNPLARTGYLDRHILLRDVKSSARLARVLARTVRDAAPSLIIPCDERAVVCLQAIARDAERFRKYGIDDAVRSLIQHSLGATDHFDAMLLKTETAKLARSLDILTPAAFTVGTPDEAVLRAETLGYPVYVKASFSWAGMGVVLCQDRADLTAALAAMTDRKPSALRGILRRLLMRDWYPKHVSIDVQKAIVGQPAMYCVSAKDGHTLAGLGAVALRTTSPTGPSSIVELGVPQPQMAAAAAKLVAAFGASGILGFDFIIEARTGDAYFLECNPRPIPIAHLGPHVGVDLCDALAKAYRNGAPSRAAATSSKVIALFPQEWTRSPGTLDMTTTFVDVPWDDPDLLRAMITPLPAGRV